MVTHYTRGPLSLAANARRVFRAAATIGTILTLAACASSRGLKPDRTPIEPTSLRTERTVAHLTLSPAAWPQTDWWTSLRDAQLNALIVEALAASPTLMEADARARRAQADAAAANASREPEVNASARVAEVRVPTTLPPIGNGHSKAAKYVFANFAWDLDIWGGERAAYEAALGLSRAAEIDAQAARITVSGNVARAYVQLGYAYAQQDVALAELDRATEVRTLTRQRVAAGIDNQTQLRQSDSEAASAQGQKAHADRAIDSAQSELAVLLGAGPDRGLDITRPQLSALVMLSVPSNLPVELLGHRADLVAARWRVEASDKDIKAATTQFLPNVNIGAMAGLIVLGGGSLFEAKSRLYDATPAISLPIFDGGRRRANLNSKDAQYDLAVAQYDDTLIHAVNQVADEHDALESLQVQMEAQQLADDAAKAAWILAEQRFKGGVGSYLEALSIRQELLVADERLAALRAQQLDVSIQMIQALGGGYRPSDSPSNVSASLSDAASPPR
jgi:NodT family efflux transporter outer membrane factor (OMF) lipoprotein